MPKISLGDIAPISQKVLENILAKQKVLKENNKDLELLEYNRQFEEWDIKNQIKIKEKFSLQEAHLALEAQINAYQTFITKLLSKLNNDEERKKKLQAKLDYKIARGLSKQLEHQEQEHNKYTEENLKAEIKRNKNLVEDAPQWLKAHLAEWQNICQNHPLNNAEKEEKIYAEGFSQIINSALIGALKVNNFVLAQEIYKENLNLLPLEWQDILTNNFKIAIYKYFIFFQNNLIEKNDFENIKKEINHLKINFSFLDTKFLNDTILELINFNNLKIEEKKIEKENIIYQEILNNNLTPLEMKLLIEKNIPLKLNYFTKLSKNEKKEKDIYKKFEIELLIYESFLKNKISNLAQLINLVINTDTQALYLNIEDLKCWEQRINRHREIKEKSEKINYYYLALNKINNTKLSNQEFVKSEFLKNLFYANISAYEAETLVVLDKLITK